MQESEITSHNYNSQLVQALLLVNLAGHISLYGPLNSKVYLNWNLPSLFEPTNIIIISLTLYTLTSVNILFITLFFTHFLGADKENLFANHKVPSLVTISFILMTLMCDSGVIL